MGALPVDPEALGALHVGILGPEHVGWHQARHLRFASFFQWLVALQAQAERAEVGVQLQLVHHLAYLLCWSVAADEDGPQAASGNYPPFHELGVPGHHHPPLRQRESYHAVIVAVVEEHGIVAHHAQPPGHLPDVYINDELRAVYIFPPEQRAISKT